MKMISEYLEHAVNFDRMASEAADEGLQKALLDQAAA